MSAAPKNRRPPRVARTLVRLRRLGSRTDEVEADLREAFDARTLAQGTRAARRQYWRDALSLWWHAAPRDLDFLPKGQLLEVRSMWQDIVFALRLFRRERTLSIVTLTSVMLAVGLTTALFGILNKVAWPETGVREPENVFTVASAKRGYTGWTYADFTDLEAASSIAVVASVPSANHLSADPRSTTSRPTRLAVVSGRYFAEMGGQALRGRLLNPGDDEPGAPPAIVLSRTLWKRMFDADAGVVGRTLWLAARPVTVVGVADSGFAGPGPALSGTAFWISFEAYGRIVRGTDAVQTAEPWRTPVFVFGRLAPDSSSSRAETELTSLARAARLARGQQDDAKRIDVDLSSITTGENAVDSDLANAAVAILAVVLLIASVNIANVLLAGALRRRREISTRLALGAGRWRIVRQLFTESVVIGVLGGVAGLLAAAWMGPIIGRLLDLPAEIDVSLDGRSYLFAAASTLVAAVGAGLVPALYGRRGDLFGGAKSGAGSAILRLPASRLRAFLIAGQTMASIVLLVAAALFTRTLVHLTSVDVGFRPESLMSVEVSFGSDYDGPRRLQYWMSAIERIREIRGVESVAVAGYGPMGGASSASESISAAPSDASRDALGAPLSRFHRNSTTAGYFETIGLPVLRGRTYTDDEVRTSAPVAVISAGLARAAWGDADPVGSTLERVWGQDDAAGAPRKGFLSKPAGTRVIGVVGDTVTSFMRPQTAIIYMPFDETIFGPLLVRATDPAAVSAVAQDALLALNPQAQPRVTFVADGVREQLRLPRALVTLALLLGLTALGLAVVGLFGVTAFVVDQRRHEVSVRVALGATVRGMTRMLMRDSLAPVAVGAIVGLILAPLVAGLLRVVLFGVSPYDPWAFAAAALLLAAAAATAVFFPARRASRVDPVTVLKSE